MYDYYAVEGLLESVMPLALGQLIFTPLIALVLYVFYSLGLYTIAQRRGLRAPWLAWIPVANVWLLGSLSDQYRYVVKGQTRSRRKLLLALKILSALLQTVAVVLSVSMLAQSVFHLIQGYGIDVLLTSLLRRLTSLLGMLIPLAAVSIALAVIQYMALYDVFRSLDPRNCVVFLVLSIFFPVTKPFFLFFNRNKDLGMPPRRPEPVRACATEIPRAEEADPF